MYIHYVSPSGTNSDPSSSSVINSWRWPYLQRLSESCVCRLGGKDLIADATLMLAFGRRYGLVGRNGTGGLKPTLTRFPTKGLAHHLPCNRAHELIFNSLGSSYQYELVALLCECHRGLSPPFFNRQDDTTESSGWAWNKGYTSQLSGQAIFEKPHQSLSVFLQNHIT
jgi:hypothetical protein